MRRHLPLAAAALLAATVGCTPSPSTPPEKPADNKPDSPTAPKAVRPPQPMMATPAWGEKIARELGADLPPPTAPAAELLTQSIDLLHSLEPGSELRARNTALQAWKAATDDEQRGLALAIVAAAMVYDPTVDGYVERLTDAYGLAAYAGSVNSGGSDGQSLRAIVGAAAGATRQARELISVVEKTPRLPEAARPLLALARAAANDRSNDFFAAADAGLKARPGSDRLRFTKADRLIDLGFYADAVATVGDSTAPALQLTAARARVLDGDAKAVDTLKTLSTSLTGTDEARRAEALFYLAEAQLLADDDAGAAATAAQFEARAGWQREAKLVKAEIDVRAGKLAEALAALKPITQGTPVSTMTTERRMTRLALDVAAAVRDADAVERAVRRLGGLDADVEAIAAARDDVKKPAAAVDGKALWRNVAAPAPALAGTLRARRAAALSSTDLARRELEQLVKAPDNRAARALYAALLTGREQAAAGAAALAGKGPPLVDSDLLLALDALGAAPTPTGKKTLEGFVADPRPLVGKMATRSLAELASPELRNKRIAVETEGPDAHGHGGHDDHDFGGLPSIPRTPAAPITP